MRVFNQSICCFSSGRVARRCVVHLVMKTPNFKEQNLKHFAKWKIRDDTLLKVSHDGISCEITKLMQIPMNTLCYLIKLVSLFPSYIIYSPFVALSIFCRLIKLLSHYQTLAIVGFRIFFIGVYISLMISQDIPSCETFSREAAKINYKNWITVLYDRVGQVGKGISRGGLEGNFWEEGLPSCIQSRLECLNACWWRRDYTAVESILKAWSRSSEWVGAAKTASHGKSRRPCIFCTYR